MTTAPTGQPRRSLTLVADALTAADCAPRLRGDHIDARCPAHDDRSPSLSVDWRDGATFVHCHTGCTAEDVLAVLDLHPRDLFDAPWEPGERHGDHTPRPRAPRPPRAPQKPRGPRCVDGHGDHRWASLHREPRDDATQQWWPYVDEQGTVVALKVKLFCTRDGCTGKTFRWRYPTPAGRLTYSRPAGLAVPLYRLPEIREAIDRGEPIHWCEGEKDADAVRAAGAAATTHGSKDTGTGGHVKDHHIRAVADAPDITVWADRDTDGGGLTSARSIARRLTTAGARHVRVVEALDGKDAHDHLITHRHALDDARDVTNVVPGPGHPTSDQGDQGDQGDPEMPPDIDRAAWRRTGVYGTDGLSTWQLVTDRDGTRWTCLLDASVTVLTERAAAVDPDFPDRAEDGSDTDLEASGDVEITLKRGDRRRTKTYRGVPTSRLRALAPLDQFGPSAWLGADTTTTGRSRILRAVLELSSKRGITPVDFYSVTGWHPAPDGGELFIHGAGGIGPAGALPDVETRLGDHLSSFALGEPAAGAELVEAVALTLDLIEVGAVPGRVLVPIAGIGMRPLFGQFRAPGSGDGGATASGWVNGGYGSGKSGATAASLNPVYPGLTWNGFPLKAGSAKHGGASGPFLERILFRARDLLLPFDDCDPSEPEASRAAWHSDFLRRAAGQYGRGLATTIGSDVRASMPCRAGVLGTGEPLDAEASAASRTVNINIGSGDVRISELRRQTGPDDRAARGRLGAGIVAALAADRPRYRALLAQARTALRPLFVAGDAPGPVERAADVFAEIAATWRVVLVVAVDSGMTRADARHHWSVIVDGLREAWRDHLRSIGTGDRSSRALAYVREALASGAVRLDDKDHGAGKPSVDMHGWEHRVRSGLDGQPLDVTAEEMSKVLIGYQDAKTRDVFLLPGKTTEAVRSAAERAGDHWTGNTAALGSALKAAGALHTTDPGATDPRATTQPRIAGKRVRAWHVPAERFDADNDEPSDYAGADYSGHVDAGAAPLAWLETPGAPGGAPGSTDHVTCTAPGGAPGTKPAVTCTAPGAPGKSAPSPHGDTAPGVCAECGRETEQWRAAEGLMCTACLDWARAHDARCRVCRAPLAPARAASGLCRDHEPPTAPGPDPEPEDPPAGPTQPTPPEPPEPVTEPESTPGAGETTPTTPGPEDGTQGREDQRARRAERTRKRTAEREAFDTRARTAVAEGRLPRVLAALEGPYVPTLRGRRPFYAPPLPGMTDAAWVVTGYAWQREHAGPVLSLDRSGAWISGASSTTVAHGALEHTGDAVPDVSRPGYYLLDAYRWTEDGMPSPLGSLNPPDQVWVPHPTAQLLAQLSREGRWPDATPVDSYTGDPVRLTSWVEWVARMRADIIDEYGRDSEEYISVKRSYGMAMSMMLGTKDESMRTEWRCKLRRPDWTHSIQSQASATLWRTADKAQTIAPEHAPVALRNVDELVIPPGALSALTAPRDPRPVITIDETGRALGTYKVKTIEEWKGGESE
ncbi:MAG: hypothetical protein WC288_02500 [Candidatus Paceibacterota bacterium]